MDKLFSRKRSMSIAARHKEQTERAKGAPEVPATSSSRQPEYSTLKKAATTSGMGSKKAGKRKEAIDQAFGIKASPSSAPLAGTRRNVVDDKAPSLTLDIRNSLMLPGLSQRFSVLLPKLSTAPETSLRSMLASQRARQDGPSLTLEEEELLFADIRDNTQYSPPLDNWDGSAPSTADSWRGHSADYLSRNGMPTSTSSPSILSQSSEGTQRERPYLNASTSSSFLASPPPTSNSFSSFQTFGNQQSDQQKIKTKSYGFSGRSQMRDETYLRKVSGKHLNGSTSSRKSGRSLHSNESTSPNSETAALPAIDSATQKESHHDLTSTRAASDGTATPTPSNIAGGRIGRTSGTDHSPSSSISLAFPPLPTIPDANTSPGSASWASKKAKRQSHLAGLSADQQKRISQALIEINSKLGRSAEPAGASPVDEEEVLEPETIEDEEDEEYRATFPSPRRPSRTESEGSFQSQHSAPFPFGLSPLKPENADPNTVEPPSPSRLPPSPRSHNLKAHVEGPTEPIPPLSLANKLVSRGQMPEPILTPSKQQPIKHGQSPSTSSPSAVSPIPGYIPGQPRPIGSMHRSDGSVSSRSATPTSNVPAELQGANGQSYLKGHLRAGSTPTHPPPVTSRTSSLGRSRSVNQTTESRLDDDSPLRQHTNQGRMLGDQGSILSRRPSSNVSSSSPSMIQEESEEEDDSRHDGNGSRNPDIRLVAHRREVSQSAQDPQAHVDQARNALGWNMQQNEKGDNRIVSHQAFVGQAEPNHDPASLSDYYRSDSDSITSASSDFAGNYNNSDAVIDALFGSQPASSEGEVVQTPPSTLDPAALSDSLRKLSGLGQQEMALLQERLVSKAQAERQAIRDDSPTVPYSPALASGALPARSASLARGQSPMPPRNASPHLPPSSWRRPSAGDQDRPVPSTHPTPPKSLAGLFTPPSATELAVSEAQSSSTSLGKQQQATLPEPPLTSTQTPSAEGHDEMIYTPQSEGLSRKPSNIREGKVALENDPEVRRDFEARIAAATAALNKTPGSGAKLDRKPTKKGQMVISSPKLVSSSSNVSGTPLSPPDASLDSSTKKALEKTSGSTRKMSGRWRKLGFRRGPSLSSQTAEPTLPPTPPSAKSVPTPPLGATPKTEKKLEEAINLPKGSSISPDLENFKFPPIGNRQQPRNPALRDRPISPPMPYQPTMQQVAERIPSASASQFSPSRQDSLSTDTKPGDTASVPAPQMSNGNHSHSSSSESAVAKFIESGRALGLNPEQLDHMLVANGMLDRSATTASSRSYQSTAPTSDSLQHSGHSRTGSQSQPQILAQPTSAPPQIQTVHQQAPAPRVEDKPKGGIFRSLSKSVKRSKADDKAQAQSSATASKETPEARNVVVRRTLLVPHPPPNLANLASGPQTPTMNKTRPSLDSPDSSRGFPGRKQSIKRKPLNLTREDVELVSNSPPPSHRRNFSTGTVHSNRSQDGAIEPLPAKKGLGFLHPLAHNNRSVSGGSASMLKMHESPGARSTGSKRRSSTGGSLYDLYGDDSVGQEEMLRPERAVRGDEASGTSAASSSQAVEICEYADGQVVWSLVNGMRGDEQEIDEEDQDYSFSSHSRGDSFTSNTSSGQNEAAPAWPARNGSYTTPALNLRHRDRGPPAPRPETFVYRAASSDVADLIDHLSRDLDASRGRIDIRHLGPPVSSVADDTARSSPFQYSVDTSRSGGDETVQNSPDPRFADPPSPNPPRSMSRPSIPPPIFAPTRTALVPAGGFSPKRQMMVRQGFAAHRANVSQGGKTNQQSEIPVDQASPSGLSFESQDSEEGQRTVEERLQGLLDRMKAQNDRHEAQYLAARSNRI